ncbi:type II secretion system protein F [Ornithinimicrobium avium]|uniref:Type II secretion system protein F n=1 Tax=Ornithinimicrobium avium TaxID=2283195 RepID=A0A345NKU1_9MICO|nr:type II secretion system protein F [Ornithinimicrobium avium]
MTPGSVSPLWLGVGAIALAAGLVVTILAWPVTAVDVQRRLGARTPTTLLTRSTDRATGLIDRLVGQRGSRASWERVLDRAGIQRTVPEFILLVGAGSLVGLAVGYVVGGPVVGVLLAGFAVAGAVLWVSLRSDKRKADFADQLDDILTLLASNLRAGHSLQHALDAMSREVEQPAASEMARAVTQVRVGRDLSDALGDVADRMDSDDFRWITQAIGIHRQVGGNLADVLDTVADTIRERGQVRRQVQALSAEGRLSAWVLIALPFFVILALSFLNPGYLAVFTDSMLGYLLMAVAAVLLVIGIYWMRIMVKVEF